MSTIAVLPTKLPVWRRLRWNLILYFVVLAVAPIAAAQGITLWLTSQNAEAGVINQLQSVGTLESNQLHRWLQTTQSAMDFVLADPSRHAQFVDFLTSGASDFAKQTEINQFLSNIVSDQTQGAQHDLKSFKNLFIYDTSGHVVAASDSVIVDRIVIRQPYFANSLKAGYLQPPFYGLLTGELTIVLTRPLLDASNKTVGVVAGELDINTLGQIMTERAGLGNTGETYLVSAQTNYLLTPSRFDGFPLNQAYHSQGINEALKGHNGQGIYSSYRSPSIPVIGVYQWIPDLQAGLLAEIQVDEALATSGQVLASAAVVAVIAALIAVLIGFIRISQISAPITALTQIASRIAAGDLTQRAIVRERNEIGLLADSFNGMTTQLISNINELDHKLEEIDKTNKALQVATAKAREAARVKGEFLANVSHELRTPLNAIIGFSDILLMGMIGPLNDKQEHKVTRLRQNGARLLALINDLLDLTRIEAGRLEVVQNPYSPRALVERVAAQMESLAEQTKLKFEVAIDANLPATILGDEKRTEQIVVNLLSNAFKFTNEGSVSLHSYVNPAERAWILDVTDTGIGIPPHALNLIFEEFRQLDGSYSRAYKGSGLGLAITRNLARMMGGKITVKSTMNVGSTFSVVLPLTTEAESLLEPEGALA